ncbi:class I SAM-dependent methyltransferase [Streptomyces sp. NPDC102384]|uniref:class I SAM-dependent methyltransferase n=1 Tax=Streptomyces sp. NPDC102384 TaxID=3366166 RepID=UPI0038271205
MVTPDASEPTTVPLAGWESHFADGEGFRASDDRELQLLTQQLPSAAGSRLLDVGCGLGGYAAGLARWGYDVLAVDWASSAVAAVRDRYQDLVPNLTAQRLDFTDEQAVGRLGADAFDVVTMRLVYPFFTDKRKVAERVRRLLRPGGAWAVTTPLAERLSARRYIALSVGEVGELMSGWDSGAWVDLEPGGLRCIVLRR